MDKHKENHTWAHHGQIAENKKMRRKSPKYSDKHGTLYTAKKDTHDG